MLFSLYRVIDSMELIMQHNFHASILMLGGKIVGFHYNSLNEGCPIMVAEGESQTGKSTDMRIALSLAGMFAQSC